MAEVLFRNKSEGASAYLWSFGDGTTSTEANPAHAYAQSGAYVVRLTATRGGVKSTVTKVVSIRGGSNVSFLATTSLDILTTSGGDQIVVT